MNGQKLRAVIRHEYLTVLKQPSFWIALFAVPLLIAGVLLIGFLTDESNTPQATPGELDIVLIDQAGIISEDTQKRAGIIVSNTPVNVAKEQVKAGKIDGLIVIPESILERGKYEVYADNTERTVVGTVSGVARTLVQQSLLSELTAEEAQLAISGGNASVVSFKNGEPARELMEYIVPGVFVVVFYIVLVFSVGYALYSVSEEKENRSIEMVLSYVRPQTLILGKLIGIILITFTQIAILAVVAMTGYVIARLFGNELSLPFSIAELPIVPIELIIGFGFLGVGFMFFVALMAMVGAMFPSTKEASTFSSVFFILPAIPFWGIDAILNQPASVFTQILTYVPLTSPTTVLVRNAAGNIEPLEALLSLGVLFAATLLTVYLAAKAFKLGTLEFNERIKLRSLLK